MVNGLERLPDRSIRLNWSRTEMKPCPACGTALENCAVVCPDCGASLERSGQSASPVPGLEQQQAQRSEDRWMLFRYSLAPCITGLLTGGCATAMWGPAGILVGVAVAAIVFLMGFAADLI